MRLSAFILTILCLLNIELSAQIIWDSPPGAPASFILECDENNNDQDIIDYVNSLSATFTTCANPAIISTDYDDPGSFSCGDLITIEITAADDCGLEPDVIVTIDITIEDTSPPIAVTPASDLLLTCDPSTNFTSIQDWINLGGGAVVVDDCTLDPSGFTIVNSWSNTVPECSGGQYIGFETVIFTFQDECGNTIETEANIIIEDLDAPTINFIDTNPQIIECNAEDLADILQTTMEDILADAIATDVNNCTPQFEIIWTFSPNPIELEASLPDPDCTGPHTGIFEFEVIAQDNCGNQSAITTVSITVEDTEPPLDMSNLPTDENYNCLLEVPEAPDLVAPDLCYAASAIFSEVIDDSDPCDIEIIRNWTFVDACGNINNDHEQTISVVDSQGPQWIGNEDDYLPDDITIVIADCDEGYTFPNAYFEDETEGLVWPIWPPTEDSEYQDNCEIVFTQFGPGPDEQFPEGTTVVRYLIEDECGNQLIHEFEVTIICSNCENGGIICTESCETDPNCHTCDVNDFDGYEGCTPKYEGGQLNWPASLCMGDGIPTNISWFSFVAGSPLLDVEIIVTDCIPPPSGLPGLASGVYYLCEDLGGQCIGGDVSCPSPQNPISYSLDKLQVGQIYYIFVDGCNGSMCEFEMNIDFGLEFQLDTPSEIVIEESCNQIPGFPPNTFCPETILQLDIHHEGDSPNDTGIYNPPGPYDPDIPAEFFWTFDPPINNMSEGSWTNGRFGDGYTIPPLSFEDVTETTVFEICLTEVSLHCSEIECDDCCTEITIQAIEDELYGPYEVCVEDLLDIGWGTPGWDPGEVGEDPNGDGLDWIGPTNISLSEVEDAIDNNQGILEYMVEDPDCGCPFTQYLEIIPIGDLEPVELTLYMFDCQFRNEKNELDAYDWEWENDEPTLYAYTEEQLIRIDRGSLELDWDQENCDSLLIVTVDTAIVTGALSQGPCTPAGTEYCFELLMDRIQDDNPEHPIIYPDYFKMRWIDEEGNRTHQGPCFTIMPEQAGLYTIELEYEFIDGAFPELIMYTDCVKEFGPFELDTGIASPPQINGEREFCSNDLEDKTYVIDITGEGVSYEWTFPEGAEGTIFNQPINDSISVDFTNYNFQTNEPITVVANTHCGQATPVELYVEALALPEAQFNISSPVCIDELAEANFSGNVVGIEKFRWSSPNYSSGDLSGEGPVNYSSTIPGTYSVSLVVVDSSFCESLPFEQTFEVVEPLEAPLINCSNTPNSINFYWDPIDGATGYEISVITSPSPLGPFSNTADQVSIDFDNLNVNDIIEISVIALGDEPCGDSQVSTLECQALDCPDVDWIFNLWTDTSFCVNAPIENFAYDVEGSGIFNFSSSIAGAVDINGNVNPTLLPVGVHTVTMNYSYQNGSCTQSQSKEIEVFALPGTNFTVSETEICLGEFITLDDSNVDDVSTWNYGLDGFINANNELSWTSPGIKTVSVEVTSPESLGSCTDQFEMQIIVNDTLSFGDINCIDQDLDFVHFDWDDVSNTAGYNISYSVNGVNTQTSNITESEIIIDNLNPDDIVTITVTALSSNICNDVIRTYECSSIACTPLEFDLPICSDAGNEFVLFEWEEVEGASQFEVYVNGIQLGIQDSTYLLVDGLSPGENVFIEVIALNDLSQCPDVSHTDDCTSLDCPDIRLEFSQLIEPCYTSSIGGIQLDNPVITGGLGTGTFAWNSSLVDANGVFTPEPNIDSTYMLDFEYTEGVCVYNEVFEVQITIIPEAQIIVSNDYICVTETTIVESPVSTSNNLTANWDFGNGVNASGSGFGPYELSFDAPGTYEISITILNGNCNSETVITSIEVDEALISPDIECTSITNEYIHFEWDDVANVSQYEVLVNGQSLGLISNTYYRVDGLTEGQDIELTINFISTNSCDLEPVTISCTTNSCPASYFELQDYITEMCLDGSETTQQIFIELINPPSDPATEHWSGSGIDDNGFFDPQGLLGGLHTINYSVEFEECSYDTSIVIELFDAPLITAINPINPNCYEEDQNFGSISPDVLGGTAPLYYQLDNLATQEFPATFDVIHPGDHSLTILDANGCVDEVYFEIIPAVEPNLSIDGPLTILNIETGEYSFSSTAQNIGDVIWLVNGEVLCQGTDCNPVLFSGQGYFDEQELTVQIFFNEDCFIETSIRVDVVEIFRYYIPNIISVNGPDANNSSFKMFVNSKNILVNSVNIYDRWGNLVHEKRIDSTGDFTQEGEVDFDWDGRVGSASNGQSGEVNMGVYVYLIDMIVDGQAIVETGTLTVIR